MARRDGLNPKHAPHVAADDPPMRSPAVLILDPALNSEATLQPRADGAPQSQRGAGLVWLLLALLLQAAVLAPALQAGPPATRPAPAIQPATLSAAGVVEPGDGGPPAALGSLASWKEGSRLQLSFELDSAAHVAVLWFSGAPGREAVVPLYPNAALEQTGLVDGGRNYVVPGPTSYLRLTATEPDTFDFVAVVATEAPDPAVRAVLENPSPDRVSALWLVLEEEAWQRHSSDTAGMLVTERFLPTPDGRAVAVPWIGVHGTGRLVVGWPVVVEPGRAPRTVGRL